MKVCPLLIGALLTPFALGRRIRQQQLAQNRLGEGVVRTLTRVVSLITLVVASPLTAQNPGSARLDLALGVSEVRGAPINFDTGLLADALGTMGVRPTPAGSLVAGLGVGVIAGGFGDRCLLLPGGGCAERGNYGVFTALLGIDHPLGPASVRMLVGPSYHNGEKHRSLGLQGRIDLASPAFAHLAVGLMTRVTVLPDHGNETLVFFGLGVQLSLR